MSKNYPTYPVKFLAEKVETPEDFARASDVGFNYFQGFFFSKPHTFKVRDITPSKSSLALLQVMAEANKEDLQYDRLETLIKKDVSLSYKLLRYINSAYFRRLQEISSIRQAMVMLGEVGIRRFISLIAMAKLAESKPDELARTSIVRARFCEQLSKGSSRRLQDSELFTMGLFSLIDAILDQTMGYVMKTLPLSENIKGRPVARRRGAVWVRRPGTELRGGKLAGCLKGSPRSRDRRQDDPIHLCGCAGLGRQPCPRVTLSSPQLTRQRLREGKVVAAIEPVLRDS